MSDGSQRELILRYLQTGASINPMQALEEFKCMRLAARIAEIKADGYDITTTEGKTASGAAYAVYTLRDNDQADLFRIEQ